MASRKTMMRTSVALAAIVTITVPSLSSAQARDAAPPAGAQAPAQGRGGRGGPPPYTPAAGAKDLKAVLFNWGWYMGMLRSNEEYDVLMTLEYQGKGTVQVDGQPCNATKYRTSITYQKSGERIQITGTRPNGQSCSNIEVLSGAYAWNEDIPGAELVPGKGKATPMPAAVEERMIRLWSGPQGAFKAAFAGTADPPPMTPRPQQLPADVMTVGKTSVAWVGNKPVLTFPIPGVPKATATATLDAKFMAESVVVKNGANTYEFTYSDYKDWNNPLNPAEALYAGRMTEKKNGTVARDITTTLTETAQMYVMVPVPASVKAAMKPTNQPPNWTLTQPAAGRADCSRRHAADGRWKAGSDRKLGGRLQPDHRWRHPPVWSNADEGQLQHPDGQLLGGLRVALALAVWRLGASRLQTRVLGQDSGTRSVDKQVRPDHDVPAAGDPTTWHAPADHPAGQRRHLLLRGECRLRRRQRGIPRHPDGWSQAEPTEREPRHVLREQHRQLGRGYARHRLH